MPDWALDVLSWLWVAGRVMDLPMGLLIVGLQLWLLTSMRTIRKNQEEILAQTTVIREVMGTDAGQNAIIASIYRNREKIKEAVNG